MQHQSGDRVQMHSASVVPLLPSLLPALELYDTTFISAACICTTSQLMTCLPHMINDVQSSYTYGYTILDLSALLTRVFMVILQLIERGVLLPAESSSESLTASDLDCSNLSLDTSMDQLSRMADSLAAGMPPRMALNAAALPAGNAKLAGVLPYRHAAGNTAGGSRSSAHVQSYNSLASHCGLHSDNVSHNSQHRVAKQQKQNRQGHSTIRARQRSPPSPHACPTCCDLISEETQSEAGSYLGELSRSDAASDFLAFSPRECHQLSGNASELNDYSESESELLAQQPSSLAAESKPLGVLHAQHRSRAATSNSNSTWAAATDPLQHQQPRSEASHSSTSEEGGQQAALGPCHNESAQRHSAGLAMQSPHSGGLAHEESSCFGSMPSSSHRSPQASSQVQKPRSVAAMSALEQHSVPLGHSMQSRQALAAAAGSQQQLGHSADTRDCTSDFGVTSLQPASTAVMQPGIVPATCGDTTASDPGAAGKGICNAGMSRHAASLSSADQLNTAVMSEPTGAIANGDAAAADNVSRATGHDTDCAQMAEMSESEEEFERTLADARRLRPSNQPHRHVRCGQ